MRLARHSSRWAVVWRIPALPLLRQGADPRLREARQRPLGEIARRLLAEHGMDLEDVTTTAGAATSYSIVLQLPDHDRTFWHHPGANTVFTGREVNLDGVDILHLGYPPLLPALLADDAAPLLDLLTEARSRQITTSLDLAVVDRRSSVAEVDWRRIFARIMPYVDIATPSIDDLTSALAITRSPDDELVEECARGWSAMDAPSPWCRRVREERTRSALARSPCCGWGRSLVGPVYMELDSGVGTGGEPRLVASTTGAGDAASAGLLYGLAQGTGIRRATRLAARFAAAAIEGRRPSAEEAGRWAAELAAAGLD